MIMRKDLKRAVELVRSGLSYGEAARKVGVTRNAVAGACFRAGLRTGRAFTQGDGKRARAAAVLYAKGLTYREIARKMGLSAPGAVCGYLRSVGVKLDRGQGRRAVARAS